MPPRSATPDPSPTGGCVCVDGALLAPERASVSVFDAGLLLGDGLFESLRASAGVPYLLDRHLERLLAAAGELRFAGLPAVAELSEQVWRTLEHARLADAYVRVTITRGNSPRALAAPLGPATVIVAALPAPARSEEPVRTALIGPPVALGPSAKSTSRQAAVLARMDVERRGAREGLYVSAAGNVLEGIASNVFVCAGGRLLTPPVEECLPGITRGRVLELARAASLPVCERPLGLDALIGADAAFLTNAVQGLRPIGAVDGRALAGGGGDRLFSTLRELYEADRAALSARPPAAFNTRPPAALNTRPPAALACPPAARGAAPD